MFKWESQSLIPNIPKIVALGTGILCVLHIGKTGVITAVGILFLAIAVFSVALRIFLRSKGFRIFDFKERLYNLRRVWYLEMFRVPIFLLVITFWFMPLDYDVNKFQSALEYFEFGEFGDTVMVFAPVLPVPTKATLQHTAEFVQCFSTTLSTLSEVQTSISEENYDEYLQYYEDMPTLMKSYEDNLRMADMCKK